MASSKDLFSDIEWYSFEHQQKEKIASEIQQMETNRFLNTSTEALCKYFFDKYRIEVPWLISEEIVADQEEARVNVSHEFHRAIRDQSRPTFVMGIVIKIKIPFTGDGHVFFIKPTTFSASRPPLGQIVDNILILRIEGAELQENQVKASIERMINNINTYLAWLRGSIEVFNEGLIEYALVNIENRRERLLENQKLVAALGYKIKERDDAPKTFVAPEIRRKITPTLPLASSVPYQPEPILDEGNYDHILSVLRNMSYVMERSPSAFIATDEPTIRFHFLVQLNGHYEGQASGETFNYEGKTDILVRVDGKNIFIGECKFWKGAKDLIDTIDQILGYSNWRDTKVAILIFNRNKNFTAVLQEIQKTTSEHPNYIRKVRELSETEFQYKFSHRDDNNREMLLTILAFDIPTEE